MSIHNKVREFCSLNGYDFEVKPIIPDGCDFISSYKIILYSGRLMCEKEISKNCIESAYVDVIGKSLHEMHWAFEAAK